MSTSPRATIAATKGIITRTMTALTTTLSSIQQAAVPMAARFLDTSSFADAPIPTEPDASHKESSQPHQWHEEQEAAEAEAQRDNKEHQCGITRGSALAPPREQADDQEEPQPASALMTRRAT
jgi:hypothetical protein